jgi:hypothetical protein
MTTPMPRRASAVILAMATAFVLAGSARGSVLTFEIFDQNSFFLNGNFDNPTIQPHLPGYGYPEGFRLPGSYGDRIADGNDVAVGDGTPFQSGGLVVPGEGTIFRYGGEQGEGYTPNVVVNYGPFSIFTGGPELWREGYGNLDGILYQGSRHDPSNPIGTDYNILEIVLIADAGWDVQLYGFDLAAGGFSGDLTINSVSVYDGVPFPFLTPTNDVFQEDNVLVSRTDRTSFDFDALLGGPLTSQIIWIQIDANNLGADSEFLGIDNIRFGQVMNTGNMNPVDLDAIDTALQTQPGEVPEATSVAMWLGSGGSIAVVVWRRRRVRS